MSINSEKLVSLLILLLGIFSSIGGVHLFGNTIFTYLMYALVLINLLVYKKIKIQANATLIYIILIVLSVFLCWTSSQMSMGWLRSSVITGLNLLFGYFTFCIIANNKKFIYKYLYGVKICVYIQLIWCYLQLLLDQWNIDINTILRMDTQTKLGHKVYLGMSSNAGMLAPVFVYGYLAATNIVVKVLFVLMAFVCRSGSCMVAMIICLSVQVLLKVINKNFWINWIKLKKIKLSALVFGVIAVALSIVIWNHLDVVSAFQMSFNRIVSNLFLGITTSGSDATHIRYLTSIPDVLEDSNMINILFGFGVGTSGFQMTKYFGQYTDKIWLIESDFVDILYSVGVMGTVVFYGVLLYCILKYLKVNQKYSIFLLAVIGAGLTYNFQMVWLIIVEFLTFISIKNDKAEIITVFNSIREEETVV